MICFWFSWFVKQHSSLDFGRLVSFSDSFAFFIKPFRVQNWFKNTNNFRHDGSGFDFFFLCYFAVVVNWGRALKTCRRLKERGQKTRLTGSAAKKELFALEPQTTATASRLRRRQRGGVGAADIGRSQCNRSLSRSRTLPLLHMHMHAGSCGRARGLGEVREKIVKNSLFVYPLLENRGYTRTCYHHRLLAKIK